MNRKAAKTKRKGKMKMWIIAVVLLLGASAGGALLFTEGERREGKNLPIHAVDFKNLKDGTYVGTYEGGKYKWRANRVQVTVSSGKVTDIKLLMHKENRPPDFTGDLYGKVIASQSLQVDTVSGATITSKAYLKSVEDALYWAQK
ncbi:FMN-binding protein [Paenibacillus sp. TH7-28]